MENGNNVLLIAGGGTLGTYTAKELLNKGVSVEVVCPEEKTSNHENLKFHRTLATDDFLTNLFAKNHYDAIVNFIHYDDPDECCCLVAISTWSSSGIRVQVFRSCKVRSDRKS